MNLGNFRGEITFLWKCKQMDFQQEHQIYRKLYHIKVNICNNLISCLSSFFILFFMLAGVIYVSIRTSPPLTSLHIPETLGFTCPCIQPRSLDKTFPTENFIQLYYANALMWLILLLTQWCLIWFELHCLHVGSYSYVS